MRNTWVRLGGALPCLCHLAVACAESVPVQPQGSPSPPPIVDASMFECPATSTPDGGASDAGGSDAGVDGGVELDLPGDYSTVESAVANNAGVCARNAEFGLSDEDECIESWVTEEDVAAAVESAELDADQQEACRQAVEAVDRCALALSCDDYRFFANNTVTEFNMDICFNVDQAEIPCREDYPCVEQTATFEQDCLLLYSELCQLASICTSQ